jgi:predicted nucleotidyltransferase component of viral defense system
MNADYLNTVRLLLKVVPVALGSEVFALKGGTAINLFVRDLPRLSVDLDLVYRMHSDARDVALASIQSEIGKMASELTVMGFGVEAAKNPQGDEVKLFVREGQYRIKVEINYVFRGTICPIERCDLSPAVEDQFFTELTVPMLAMEELYGSKLVAAMDRQHPRDLFDVLGLYASVGLSEAVVECFVCYLAGHNRPVHEVLFASKVDLESAYENEFQGMTSDPVALSDLIEVRRRLFADLPRALTSSHRNFLLSLVKAQPQWELMSCSHLRALPALKWKLRNLERLRSSNPEKFAAQANELEGRFSVL